MLIRGFCHKCLLWLMWGNRLKKLVYKREIEETRGHSLAITSSDNRPSLGARPWEPALVMAADLLHGVPSADVKTCAGPDNAMCHVPDLSPGSRRVSLDRAISMAIDEEEAVTRGDLLQEFDRELARITDFYRKKVGASWEHVPTSVEHH